MVTKWVQTCGGGGVGLVKAHTSLFWVVVGAKRPLLGVWRPEPRQFGPKMKQQGGLRARKGQGFWKIMTNKLCVARGCVWGWVCLTPAVWGSIEGQKGPFGGLQAWQGPFWDKKGAKRGSLGEKKTGK